MCVRYVAAVAAEDAGLETVVPAKLDELHLEQRVHVRGAEIWLCRHGRLE